MTLNAQFCTGVLSLKSMARDGDCVSSGIFGRANERVVNFVCLSFEPRRMIVAQPRDFEFDVAHVRHGRPINVALSSGDDDLAREVAAETGRFVSKQPHESPLLILRCNRSEAIYILD